MGALLTLTATDATNRAAARAAGVGGRLLRAAAVAGGPGELVLAAVKQLVEPGDVASGAELVTAPDVPVKGATATVATAVPNAAGARPPKAVEVAEGDESSGAKAAADGGAETIPPPPASTDVSSEATVKEPARSLHEPPSAAALGVTLAERSEGSRDAAAMHRRRPSEAQFSEAPSQYSEGQSEGTFRSEHSERSEPASEPEVPPAAPEL